MTLADEINKMILTIVESLEITSANPTHINNVIQSNEVDNPDLEGMIADSIPAQSTTTTDSTLTGLTKEDATGILSKAGINPKNIPNLMALSSGKGGLVFLNAIGGAAGLSLLLGPLTAGLAVKPLTEAIIKELQRPGGFLDKRVRIDARNEAFAELDRQTRQNTRIGDRQVVIQQFQGFRNFDGYASTNTSRLIRENADRVLDIGLFERAQGVR